MIRCVVTIAMFCDREEDNEQAMIALEDGDEIEDALKAVGFLFTDIELKPGDGVKTFEKEYKR